MMKRGIARIRDGIPFILFPDKVLAEGYCEAYSLAVGWCSVPYQAALDISVSARKEDVQDIINELTRDEIILCQPEDIRQ